MVGECSPYTFLFAGLPIFPGILGRYADLYFDKIPAPVREFVSETAHTIRGKAAHNNYPLALGEGYEYNRLVRGTNIRPDAIDWENRIVRELKPDNPRSISRGERQLQRYIKILSALTGDLWAGFVDTYKK